MVVNIKYSCLFLFFNFFTPQFAVVGRSVAPAFLLLGEWREQEGSTSRESNVMGYIIILFPNYLRVTAPKKRYWLWDFDGFSTFGRFFWINLQYRRKQGHQLGVWGNSLRIWKTPFCGLQCFTPFYSCKKKIRKKLIPRY